MNEKSYLASLGFNLKKIKVIWGSLNDSAINSS